jgi:hypothetical protein
VKTTFAAGLFVAASAAAFAQQPPAGSPGSAQSPATRTQQQSTAAEQPKAGEQTITGCLTSADNIYTLTLSDSDLPPGSTVPTISYTLAPGTGVDLKPHVGKMVKVKGTEAGPGMQNEQRVVVDRSAPTPAGTSGRTNASSGDTSDDTSATAGASAGNRQRAGGTPTVETEAKAKIVAKTLNVSTVQPAAGQCQ